MIFVTVGTDEHPFDRLIREVDSLRGRGVIREEVFIQIGFARYHPEHCPFAEVLTFKEMEEKMRDARIVITTAAPARSCPCSIPERSLWSSPGENVMERLSTTTR